MLEIEKRKNMLLEFLPGVMDFLNHTQIKENLSIEKKGETDLVTEADKGCEERLIHFILKNFPHDSILGEEGTNISGSGELKWIIDPLDGTTNYSHKLPLFAISIGIENLVRNEIELGVIALPYFNDIYNTIKGNGAFKNKRQIFTSKNSSLINCLTCTGFPYNMDGQIDSILENLKKFLVKSRGIRRTGSAALDLAWVAEGRFDIFYEMSLHPWDMAAGSLMIEEAGGIVSNFQGGRLNIYEKEILATNQYIHKSALDLLLH